MFHCTTQNWCLSIFYNMLMLRLKRIVIFGIQIFGRFLNEYPNILLRPYCFYMKDKVTCLNHFHCSISLYRAKPKICTTKTENTQQNGCCNKEQTNNWSEN